MCTRLGTCCTPGGRAGFHFPAPKGRFQRLDPGCSSLPTGGRSSRCCSGARALLSPSLWLWWCSAALGARPGKLQKTAGPFQLCLFPALADGTLARTFVLAEGRGTELPSWQQAGELGRHCQQRACCWAEAALGMAKESLNAVQADREVPEFQFLTIAAGGASALLFPLLSSALAILSSAISKSPLDLQKGNPTDNKVWGSLCCFASGPLAQAWCKSRGRWAGHCPVHGVKHYSHSPSYGGNRSCERGYSLNGTGGGC